MADGENYKIQVTLNLPPAGQYAKGNMLNIRGDSFQEIGQHLATQFGEEQAKAILESFSVAQASAVVTEAFQGQVEHVQGPYGGAATVTQPQPAPAQTPQGFGAPAPQAQPPAQGAPQGGYQPQPQPQGQYQPQPAQQGGQGQVPPCSVCGANKEWRSGTRQNGTAYNFWGCPNWKDQVHVNAKAAGVRF